MLLGASSTSYRRSVMMATDPGAVAVQLIFALVDASAITVLVFMRKGFGERFYTIFKFGLALGLLSALLGLRSLVMLMGGMMPLLMGAAGVSPFLGMMAGSMFDPPHSHPHVLFDAAKLFYWAFILVGGAQLAAVWIRSWRSDATPVYSRSTGEPLLAFGGRVNHWIATIFLEPFAVLLIGQFLTACDPRVPYTFFVVLALFLQASALHQWRLYKDDLLDQQDARVLAGFYTDQAKHVAAGGKPTSKLGAYFPLLLPRKRAMQVDVLRRWAARYRAEVPSGPPILESAATPGEASAEARADATSLAPLDTAARTVR